MEIKSKSKSRVKKVQGLKTQYVNDGGPIKKSSRTKKGQPYRTNHQYYSNIGWISNQNLNQGSRKFKDWRHNMSRDKEIHLLVVWAFVWLFVFVVFELMNVEGCFPYSSVYSVFRIHIFTEQRHMTYSLDKAPTRSQWNNHCQKKLAKLTPNSIL